MTEFLVKHFIKDYQDVEKVSVRTAYGVLASIVGIFCNVFLFAVKFTVGLVLNSVSVTADAFNNLSDAGSSIIGFVGVKMAEKPADADHPFGHGRMEYISGLLVSVAILIMGFELIKSSVEKIISPEPIDSSPVVYGILAASILVKLYMGFYNRAVGKKISSAAMGATAMDSISDTVSTALVLLATFISQKTGLILDGWFGVLVGVFIFVSGVRSMKETVDPLLGQAPGKELVDQIRKIVTSSPNVYGMHDLIVHDYGPGRRMISLHAEIPADGDLMAIHDEIDNIEAKLRDELHCSATIHMDPIVTNDAETNEMRSRVAHLAKEIDPKLSIHDFRMVKGDTHTNLIFDVAVPYECHLTDVEVSNEMKEKVKNIPGHQYFAVMQIDRVYV